MYTSNFLIIAVLFVGLGDTVFNLMSIKGENWLVTYNSSDVMYVGLYKQCIKSGINEVLRCEDLGHHLYKSFIDTGVAFSMIAMLLVFALVLLNLLTDVTLHQEWNINGFLISSSSLISSISIIIETTGVILYFSNKPDKLAKQNMKLSFQSTSFAYFILHLLVNQLLVCLSFYTLSFMGIELNSDEINKNKIKIKNRCLKEANVVDIKSAPKSTPAQMNSHQYSYNTDRD